MIEVSERTRRGCSIAATCAIIPPIDAPTRCAPSMPRASIRPTVSAAMSDSVYEADPLRPSIAAATSGRGAPVMWLESPMSRLSNRMTCRPRRASATQNASGHAEHLRPQAHDEQHGRRLGLAEPLEGDVDAGGPDAVGDLHAQDGQVCATGSSMLISGRW